jgi:hypothetical protein
MQMITILPVTDIGSQGGMAMSISTPSQQERVRRLNDRLRTAFISGRVMLSAGVRGLSDEERATLLQAVSTFSGFTPANDPYGEHDFGRIELGGFGYFFKIDYYDLDFRYQSPDPADAAVTARVMTIIREDEY